MGLIFDGIDLEERFGLLVDGEATWPKPKRDRELVHVPGRNGDLIFDNGCWENVEITYRFLIKDGWQEKFDEFANWLCRHRGYYKLEDPKRHPDCYRMAEFADSIDPTLWFTTRTGVFDLTFNCKPQQFLYSGESPIMLMYPRVVANELSCCLLPVAGEGWVRLTPHLGTAGTYTMVISVLNSSKVVISEIEPITLQDGEQVTEYVGIENAAFWRFTVTTPLVSIDTLDFSMRVVCDTYIRGEYRHIDVPFQYAHYIENPTGHATKPLMVIDSTSISMGVRSFNFNNEWTDWYSFVIWDYSSKSDYAVMDCESQFIYYEYETTDSEGYVTKHKESLGSYLHMTDSQSNVGEALSFPEFGENRIRINASTSVATREVGIIEIYPRWWRI